VGLFYFGMDMDMAKRFTDTTKWDNPWYRKMPWEYRSLWDYILDKCDHAGIWRADLGLASYIIGKEVSLEGMTLHFGDRFTVLKEDKVFIASFITFQYGELKSDSKVHSSVIKLLISNNIDPDSLTLTIGLPKGYLTPKDKDKDKDKEKGECEGKNKFDFEALYKTYPRKLGKAEGLGRLKGMIKTEQDYQDFQSAVANYNAHLRKNKTEPQFIKHFSSFVGTSYKQTWRDWLDKDAGQATTTKTAKISMSDEMLAMALGKGNDE
jgi:hypothetical protein